MRSKWLGEYKGIFFWGIVILLLMTGWFACTQRNPVDPTKPIQDQIYVLTNMTASPDKIIVSTGQSIIRVRIYDEDSQPVAGKEIYFSTNLGTVNIKDTTDSQGWAQTILTSGATPGTATVKAASENSLPAEVNVSIFSISDTHAHILIDSDKQDVLANGLESVSITVTLVADSSSGNSGKLITFSAVGGSITPVVTTDSKGQGTATFTSIASRRDTFALVIAEYHYQDTVATNSLILTERGIQLALSANPSSIVADGVSESTVSVVLKESTSKIAISNATIRFSADPGLIPSEERTDTKGVAEVALTSSNTPDTSEVIARYGNEISESIDVVFLSSSQAVYSFSEITADPSRLLSNGTDQSAVTIKLVDENQDPVPGETISFSTTGGALLYSSRVTDANGLASTVLIAPASQTDGSAQVTASWNNGAATINTTVTFVGVQFTLTASPKMILADGQSQSTVTVILKETTSQVAVSDAVIVFSTDAGTIPNQAETNSAGVAQTVLTSGTEIDTAHITATYGSSLSHTTEVYFVTQVTTYILTEESASPNTILANGVEQSTLSVKVVDNNWNPVQGDSIRFISSAGIVTKEWVVTGSTGIATTKLTARASRYDSTATVTMTRGGGAQSVQTTVAFQGVQLSVSAVPAYILANGQSTSNITAILKKTTSQVAISGAPVIFSTNAGTIPNQQNTDATGVAQVSLTSSTIEETAFVYAYYGNTLWDSVHVHFSLATSSYTLGTPTAGRYNILANGEDQTTISVLVEENNNPASGVLVDFSSTEGTIQAQGTTNASGIASVPITADTSSTDKTAIVTAQLGILSTQTNILFEGIQFDLSASPVIILADGNSTSNITAHLKKRTSQVGISGATVTFATTHGTIPNSGSTNSSGVAQQVLTSGTTPTTATVTASYGNIFTQTVQVEFQESVPTYIEVSATPPVLPADGQSQSTIRATISDANRNPVPDGTAVEFEIIDGSGTVERHKTTTDGVATSTLICGTAPDTAQIRVSVAALADTVEVVYTVGNPDQILVSSDKDSLAANGIETATIQARVLDAQGNPIPGLTVSFSSTIGDITPNAQTNSLGIAFAQFSSGNVGMATITATVSGLSGNTNIRLIPGPPNTIQLNFTPKTMGVKDTGQNQTVTVEATVLDSKNNPVVDGTYVKFRIVSGPQGVTLSSTDPIPTVGGVARVSCSSGIRSGNVRIRADVTDAGGALVSPPVTAISTELIIHAGPPYIEDINDLSTSHLTIAATRLNVWATIDTTVLTILVGDKYNNPVQQGTAVYLTTSGGVVTTVSYTDQNGIAKDTLITGNPQPTIDRYYNYIGMQDPNLGWTLPGSVYYSTLGDTMIPNYDAYPDLGGGSYPGQDHGRILNSEGNNLENDGIARVIAYSEGMDANGDSAKAWDWLDVVYSGIVGYEDNSFDIFSAMGGTLYLGESATIRINLMDGNGNPIESNSTISAEIKPGDVQAELSWNNIDTGWGQGTSYYYLTISNAIDVAEPKPGYVNIKISWNGYHQFGTASTYSVYIAETTRP